jgi:hypothetical protein
MIDDILSALDAPRSAIWNAGRGISNLISGDSDSSTLKDILPGILGGIGTAGLAATGVGLPLAILGGSALGGIGQAGFGNQAMKPSDFAAKHLGVDPDSTAATIGGMIAGGATDPLTFAGAGLGKMAGRGIGGVADQAAMKLGPRYRTTADDLHRMASEYRPSEVSELLQPPPSGSVSSPASFNNSSPMPPPRWGVDPMQERINLMADKARQATQKTPFGVADSIQGTPAIQRELEEAASSPLWDRNVDAHLPESTPPDAKVPTKEAYMQNRITKLLKDDTGFLGHIPPNSSILGSGAEAIAFKTPQGDVIRLADRHPGGPGRPISPDVLQSSYATDLQRTGVRGMESQRIERLPAASDVGHNDYFDDVRMQLEHRLGNQNLRLTDPHAGNVGSLGGRPIVIDPGAVEDVKGFSGAYQPVTQAGQPGQIASLIERLVGGRGRMQSAVESGLASPGYQRMLQRPGTAGGGLAGLILGEQGR